MKPSTTTEGTPDARKPSDGSEKRSTEAGKSFALPRGFRFGAVAAGIREAGGTRKDLALILSDTAGSHGGRLHGQQDVRGAHPVRSRAPPSVGDPCHRRQQRQR